MLQISLGRAGAEVVGLRYVISDTFQQLGCTGSIRLHASAGSFELKKGVDEGPPSTGDAGSKLGSPTHLYEVFTIEPSVLSPLYAFDLEGRQLIARKEFIKDSITAQLRMSESITADDTTVVKQYKQKLRKLEDLHKLLHDVLQHRPVEPCRSRDKMHKYFQYLELRSINSVQPSLFQEVMDKRRDALQHWSQEFADVYKFAPRMPNLLEIYSKHHAEQPSARTHVRKYNARMATLATVDNVGIVHAVGKRKTSVAAVCLQPGKGRIVVNGIPVDAYFVDVSIRGHVFQPFFVTNSSGQYNVSATVYGGGYSGQAQALRHGIAKALSVDDARHITALNAAGLLARDPRAVERKKFGKAKARKSFTWVKR